MKVVHLCHSPKSLILRCERSEPRRTHTIEEAPDRRCVLRGSALRASHLSMRRFGFGPLSDGGLASTSNVCSVGGGRGIGLAIAEALSGAGARVTILGRDAGALGEAVAAGKAHGYMVADVTDAAAVKMAADIAAEDRGPIDLLIANAGAAQSAPFAKSDAQLFRRMLDVNFLGVVHAAQAVLGPMVERGFGRIVAIASTAGLKGYPYVSAYCAAKHAVVGLVRALAL